MSTLENRTIVMSGGSRGIGLAIAVRAARDGANVVMLAKTGDPHPRLPGTIHTAVSEIEAAGGRAVAVVGDVRRDEDVERAIQTAMERFGGIDIVINNASAIDLRGTADIDMKSYDLMQNINARGAFLLSKLALPYLRRSDRAHILTLSPPINLNPQWASSYLGYTMAKYSMSLTTLGLAEELRPIGIAVNSLWPQTTIGTAVVANLLGGDDAVSRARTPAIMADAAYAVLTRDSAACTGNFFTDEQVLRDEGVTEFDQYRVTPGSGALDLDLFLDASAPREERG
ncbi:SDR family oxidoreductase (plasmid) [Mycolicibacterium psychrotolerans]|uniref:SDR family oxidoreductase n=1 Tax=Mycolicibacterium psychrotolerans TaxID=216929 RepID=UPI003D674608